jgi:hypothetical protein
MKSLAMSRAPASADVAAHREIIAASGAAVYCLWEALTSHMFPSTLAVGPLPSVSQRKTDLMERLKPLYKWRPGSESSGTGLVVQLMAVYDRIFTG